MFLRSLKKISFPNTLENPQNTLSTVFIGTVSSGESSSLCEMHAFASLVEHAGPPMIKMLCLQNKSFNNCKSGEGHERYCDVVKNLTEKSDKLTKVYDGGQQNS